MSSSYNGLANKETWTLALLLNSDTLARQRTLSYLRGESVAFYKAMREDTFEGLQEHLSLKLRTFTESEILNPHVGGRGFQDFVSDTLREALDRVNWRELVFPFTEELYWG